MFKVSEKCTTILAAEAKLTREKVCYRNAVKDKDVKGMERAKRKMDDTVDYMKLIEEWPPAEYLAIGPAVCVARIKSASKKEAIKTKIQRVIDTGIDPLTGEKLDRHGVTGIIIQYLIAKHDNKPFARPKTFLLTHENINAIKYAVTVCRENPLVVAFLQSLMKV
jgi:hypothetical protein